MSTKKNPIHKSETSRRIYSLRKLMNLSQEDFAEKLGVGRIAAVYWESGRSKPSAETYIAMAKVAREFDPSSAVWFWEQVGVDRDALRDLLPEFNRLSMQAEQRVRDATEQTVDGIVRVPLLRNIAGIKSPTFASEDEIEAWFPLPALLVPNPTKTSCLWAPQGMSSLGLGSNDLLVIEYSDATFEKLGGQMVIAEHKKSGETYAGFLEPYDMNSEQIPALRVAPLSAESFNNLRWDAPAKTTFFPMKLGKKQGKKEKVPGLLLSPGHFRPMWPVMEWKILGRVIYRIGYERGGGLERLAKAD